MRIVQQDAKIISWNVMIIGYAQNWFFEKALETFKLIQLLNVKPNFVIFANKDAPKLFDLMKHLVTNPNSITFLCFLLACNHAYLVDESYKCFNGLGII